MSTPFKMKGNPMQRNFGIGDSPMKQKEEKKTSSTKPPKVRRNPKTGKQEMHTGSKTNPVTGKKTDTYSAY